MLTRKELMLGDWVMYNPNVFIEDEYEPAKDSYPTKIESGIKKEEYREIKPYWSKRFVGEDEPVVVEHYSDDGCNVFGYTHVRFRYGYTKRTMLFELKEIKIDMGKSEWGAPEDKEVFILKLGDRIQ